MTLPLASLDLAQSAHLIRDLLRDVGAITLRVTGRCMEPALAEGTAVSVLARRPRLGEVALVHHAEGLRLHRVVWTPLLGQGRFRTRADRGAALDGAVAAERVLGTLDHPVSAREAWGHALRAGAAWAWGRLRGRE